MDILGQILCNLFNHSIQNETYPSILKIAKVIPVYKNGDISDPSSYRPISVLSVVNNIFEKSLSNRINKFLQKYMVLCPQQHGFRSNYSTSSAVLTLAQSINTALNNNKLAGVVFLDLQKAFNTVDNSILLHKLKHYGIRNQAYELFSNYIKNRQKAVVMTDITSTLQYLNTGVPQGSVLGPLFFSLYINDLPHVLSSSEIIMYADDTALICTADNVLELQRQVNAELKKIPSGFLLTG